MTHPFITAVQSALDTCEWPDDVDTFFLSPPSNIRPTYYCSVTLKSGYDHNGTGPTFADAYAKAMDALQAA
jgi:hypothetical protein